MAGRKYKTYNLGSFEKVFTMSNCPYLIKGPNEFSASLWNVVRHVLTFYRGIECID